MNTMTYGIVKARLVEIDGCVFRVPLQRKTMEVREAVPPLRLPEPCRAICICCRRAEQDNATLKLCMTCEANLKEVA